MKPVPFGGADLPTTEDRKMKTITMKLAAAVLTAMLLVLVSGCAVVLVGGAAAGVGTLVYQNGELRTREYAAYDKGWSAALAAMSDLGYAVVSQEKDVVDGKIVARAPGDKKITIRVTKVSGNITEFGVRIGSMGDKDHSQPVMDAIKKRL
jgi:hypothetical protein